jgi:hypothetical protein
VTSWVGSISFDQRGNWAICKRDALFGSNTRTALGVRAGDELFIWGSQQGWLARCRATADARPPHGIDDVPWPEPEKYTALIPIELLDEPSVPVFMLGSEILRTAGIGTVRLPQFPRLDAAASDHLRALLSTETQRESSAAAAPLVVEVPQFEGRRGRLLSALAELRTDRQLGVSAPYQQLVLLWSIVRAIEGGDRVSDFSDVRDELRALLAPFAVGESRPDPELPWFALRKSEWWQFFGDVAEAERRGGRDFVRRMNPAAGLSREVFELLRADRAFRGAAVQILSAPLASHPQRATVNVLAARAAATSTDAPIIDIALPSLTVAVEIEGPITPGRVYDRDQIHERARRAGLPPGNRMSGITVVGDQLCVFWNPFKALYANGWVEEPIEFTYSGEGSSGDQDESSGGNRALIEHETSGQPVSVFIKTRREGSAWVAMGSYLVSAHEWGTSTGQDGLPRRDLQFTLRARDTATVPDPALPVLPAVPAPGVRTEADLWRALERGGQTGERRRATVVRRDRRMSDPLKTAYVMERAIRHGGSCELCGQHPGWVGDDGNPHLQAHHINADVDLVDWIAALCGTCHDRMHHDRDRLELPGVLLQTVRQRQKEAGRPVTALPEPDAREAREHPSKVRS